MRKKLLAVIVLLVLGSVYVPGNTVGLMQSATTPWQVVAQDGDIPFAGQNTTFNGTLGTLTSQEDGTYGILTTRDGENIRLLTDDTHTLRQYQGQPVQVVGDILDPLVATDTYPGYDQVVRVDRIDTTVSFTQDNPLTVGDYPFVTLICQFAGDASSGGSIGNLNTLYAGTTGDASLINYFAALSYDQLNLAGSAVAGPFTLDIDESSYSGNFIQMTNDCAEKADPSVNFDLYEGINFLFNDNDSFVDQGGTLSITALGGEAYRITVIQERNWLSMRVVAQQLGLAFGLNPSAGPASNPQTNGANPSPWDFVSGQAQTCNVVDPTFGCLPQGTIGLSLAETVSWIPDIHEEIVADNTAREIRLTKTNGPAVAKDRYIKVPLDDIDRRFYTIEVRKLQGYDQNLPGTGVIIHEVDRFRGGGLAQAQVVNSDGSLDLSTASSIWTVGETFTDATNNVTIQVLSDTDDPNAIDVYVSNNAPTPVDTPTGLSVTGATETTVTIGWNDVTGETGYRVYRWDFQDDGEQWVVRELTIAPDNTSYTDEGLDCSETFRYQVRSLNGGAESLWSSVLNASPSGCPATGILVNEVDTGEIDAIELVNLNPNPVDLVDFDVTFYNGNSELFTYTFASTFTIPGSGYVILSEASGTPTADTVFMNQDINWPDDVAGGAVIVRNSIDAVVDFMRFGESSLLDPSGGWTPPNAELPPSNGFTIGRDPISTDTDTGTDFFVMAPTMGSINQTSIEPENDIRANAVEVDTPIIYYEDISLATDHSSDPAMSCAPNATQTLWYAYTGETNGETIRVSAARTDYNEAIAVYRADDLTPITCNNGGTPGTSEVAFTIDNGVTYYIMVARAAAGGGNNMVLSISRDPVYDRTVTGFVYEMDGTTPLGNVRVTGFGAEWTDFTCSAADGSYTLTGAPREYDVTVYADGGDAGYCGRNDRDREYFEELNFSPGTTFNMDEANASNINFTLEPLPGVTPPTPQLVTPLDDGGVLELSDRTPMLSWYAVTGADSYTVTLYDEPGTVFREEIVYNTPENICDMTSFKLCNVSLETPLPYGSYAWTVKATRDSVDSGTPADIEQFNIGSSLQAVELLAPKDAIPAGGDLFTLRFEAQYAATSHWITVTGPGGTIFDTPVDTTSCAGQICAIDVPYSGAVGTYTVTILPFSLTNSGPSSVSTFDAEAIALTPVKLLAPRDEVPATNTFSLIFEAQAGTTAHNVNVYDPVGALVSSQVVDIGTCTVDHICTADVTTVGDPLGTYNVWIQPLLGSIGGPWYSSKFTMVADMQINPVQLLSPTGSVLPTDEIMMSFLAQEMTTDHEITIRTGGETIYNKKIDTTNCAGAVCEVMVNTNGTEGAHYVDIKAFIGAAEGPVGTSTYVVSDATIADDINVVELSSPIGNIPPGDTLYLKWDAQAGTTNHTVTVYGPSSIVFAEDVDTRHCSGEQCTLEVPYDGADGNYTVWILPVVEGPQGRITGTWNEAGRFTVSSGLPINIVKLLSPVGEIHPSDELTLQFEAQHGADSHKVDVSFNGAPPFYSQMVDTADCAGDVCTVRVAYDGSQGVFTVTLQPFMGENAGPAYNSVFTVVAEALREVTLLSPQGVIPASETLMIKFEAQAGTTSHRMDVYGPGGLIYREEMNTRDCAGDICEIMVPYDGTPGGYGVWLRPSVWTSVEGVEQLVSGPWKGNYFTVSDTLDMVPVKLASPVGNVFPGDRLALKFPAQSGTTAHNIQIVIDGFGEYYNQKVDTRWCAGEMCTVTIPYNGGLGGLYTVTLQPYMGLTGGPTMDSQFTVENPSGSLRSVVLTAPTGNIQRSDFVTLKFEAQSGATLHNINMYGPGGLVYSEAVDTTDCAGGTCEIVVPYGAAYGDYQVWIQPVANTFGGPWNRSVFTVGEVVVVPVSLLSPVGDEVLPSDKLVLRFEAQAGISQHRINVYNPAATLIYSELEDTRDCSGDICEVIVPNDGMPGQYQVWIQPLTEYFNGPWAQSLFSITDVPRQPYLLTPRGSVPPSDQFSLRFSAQAGTIYHQVVVKRNDNIIYRDYMDTTGCAGDVCGLSVPYDGAEGNYTVELTPYTSTATGPTGISAFTVAAATLNPVTLISPASGSTVFPSNMLAIQFEAQEGTTAHDIHVYDGVTPVSLQRHDTTHCTGTICTILVPYLGNEGAYSTFVRPHSGTLVGPWLGTFYTVSGLVGLQPVTLNSPTGVNVPATNTLELRFDAQAGTTAHQIIVDQPGADFFNRVINTAECSGRECTVRINQPGFTGDYVVAIRPYAGANVGPWNNSFFTVTDVGLLPVTLDSPTGTIEPSPTINIQFTAQQGTTDHRVDVYDSTGAVLYTNFLPVSECPGNVCSLTVYSSQVEGTYAAWLRPLAGTSSGPWTRSEFIVEAPAEEASPDLLAEPTPTEDDDITPDIVADNLIVRSVCAGTWELTNPFETSLTLGWEAYLSGSEVQTGTVTLPPNEVTTIYTGASATGLSVGLENNLNLYTEAVLGACE